MGGSTKPFDVQFFFIEEIAFVPMYTHSESNIKILLTRNVPTDSGVRQ